MTLTNKVEIRLQYLRKETKYNNDTYDKQTGEFLYKVLPELPNTCSSK